MSLPMKNSVTRYDNQNSGLRTNFSVHIDTSVQVNRFKSRLFAIKCLGATTITNWVPFKPCFYLKYKSPPSTLKLFQLCTVF